MTTIYSERQSGRRVALNLFRDGKSQQEVIAATGLKPRTVEIYFFEARREARNSGWSANVLNVPIPVPDDLSTDERNALIRYLQTDCLATFLAARPASRVK